MFQKFLFLIFTLHLTSLWLFKDGFLLTRNVVERNVKSNSNKNSLTENLFDSTTSQFINATFTHFSSKHRKVLIILIDALRFDFVAEMPGSNEIYHNQMTTIHHKLRNEPRKSHLFHFIADPPTTTMQRLKALFTGSLPTFIDAGSNFASGKVLDDHLLRRLKDAGRRFIFMGDDTWMSLYEKDLFNASFPYPSFEVFDLHTVDNGCMENIVRYVNWNQSRGPGQRRVDRDWDMLVAHFLGVDHVGHRYLPDHIEMKNKLSQLNGFLDLLFQSIDDDTVVFVFGDHGMDQKGDHGGESNLEVDAGLFVYSKQPLFGGFFDDTILLPFSSQMSSSSDWRKLHDKLSEAGVGQLSVTPLMDSQYPSIFQIDIVPTISSLLNIDIPFGSLGSVVPQLFLDRFQCKTCTESPEVNGLLRLLGLLSNNLKQVHEYVATYYAETGEMDDVAKYIDTSIKHLKQSIQKANLGTRLGCAKSKKGCDKFPSEKTIDVLMDIIVETFVILRKSLDMCRDVWARFNMLKMVMGLFVMFLCISYLGFQLYKSVLKTTSRRQKYSSIAMVIGTILQGLFFILQISVTVLINDVGVSLASNSFIIFEDAVVFFLLQTVLIIIFFTQTSRMAKFGSFIALALSRITSTSTICREEQLPRCSPTFHSMGIFSVFDEHLRDENVIIKWKSVLVLFLLAVFAENITKFLIWHQTNASRGLSGLRIIFWAAFFMWLSEAVEERKLVDGIYEYFLLRIKIWAPRISWIFCAYQAYQIMKIESGRFRSLYIIVVTFGFAVVTQLPAGIVMMTLILFQCLAIAFSSRFQPNFLFVYALILLGMHAFFATGHQVTFSSIQFQTGFIGLESFSFFLSGGLVILNTLGPFIFPLVGISVVFEDLSEMRTSYVITGLFLVLFHFSVQTFSSMLFTAVLRRHLMVWNVFAPRFMFSGVIILMADFILFFI